MRRIIITLFLMVLHFSLSAQILEFDQLEMRYDQRQYKTVYKRANRLLANPEYDYSFVPRYYLALSQLQLAQNKRWLKRNKFAIDEATNTFKELQSTREGQEVLRAHQHEISVLKNDLSLWAYKLNQDGDKERFKQIDLLVKTVFKDVPSLEELLGIEIIIPTTDAPSSTPKPGKKGDIAAKNLSDRQKMLKYSEKFLGVPYVYGGATPKGFDCSGFTLYVAKNSLEKSLGRSAADQYKGVKKVNRKDIKPGDLIFFTHSKGIHHVGMVYSLEDDSVQMIHASSSLGISITDIYKIDYWKKRIVGFGTIFDD